MLGAGQEIYDPEEFADSPLTDAELEEKVKGPHATGIGIPIIK